MIIGEWIISLFAFIVSLVFFVQTFTFPHVNAISLILLLFSLRVFYIYGLKRTFSYDIPFKAHGRKPA
ncbi:hypothetical protein MASR2M17_21030 [Aminivibrio sp.]